MMPPSTRRQEGLCLSMKNDLPSPVESSFVITLPLTSFLSHSHHSIWGPCHFDSGWGNSLHIGLPTSLHVYAAYFYHSNLSEVQIFIIKFPTEKHSVVSLTWHWKTTAFLDLASMSHLTFSPSRSPRQFSEKVLTPNSGHQFKHLVTF